jgi:hypothetical protein
MKFKKTGCKIGRWVKLTNESMACPIVGFGISYFGFQGYFALAYRPISYLSTFKVRSNKPPFQQAYKVRK